EEGTRLCNRAVQLGRERWRHRGAGNHPADRRSLGLRAGFVFIGVVGLTWLLLWLPFYDDPEKSKRVKAEELDHIRSDGAPEAASERPLSWGLLLGYREAWSFIVAKFMTDPIWWF